MAQCGFLHTSCVSGSLRFLEIFHQLGKYPTILFPMFLWFLFSWKTLNSTWIRPTEIITKITDAVFVCLLFVLSVTVSFFFVFNSWYHISPRLSALSPVKSEHQPCSVHPISKMVALFLWNFYFVSVWVLPSLLHLAFWNTQPTIIPSVFNVLICSFYNLCGVQVCPIVFLLWVALHTSGQTW